MSLPEALRRSTRSNEVGAFDIAVKGTAWRGISAVAGQAAGQSSGGAKDNIGSKDNIKTKNADSNPFESALFLFCFASWIKRLTRLNNTTVSSKRCHVVGLVKEPEAMPFLTKGTQVFSSVDQLASTNCWVCIVNWQKAADAGRKCKSHQECGHDSPHKIHFWFLGHAIDPWTLRLVGLNSSLANLIGTNGRRSLILKH